MLSSSERRQLQVPYDATLTDVERQPLTRVIARYSWNGVSYRAVATYDPLAADAPLIPDPEPV